MSLLYKLLETERHQSFYLKIKDSYPGALFKSILDADSTHAELLRKHPPENLR